MAAFPLCSFIFVRLPRNSSLLLCTSLPKLLAQPIFTLLFVWNLMSTKWTRHFLWQFSLGICHVQKRRAFPGQQLAVFAHTPLTDGRSPPVLSSAFARSYHIDPSPISLGAAPKTAFLLRSIFQLVFFFLSNITSKSVSLYAWKCLFLPMGVRTIVLAPTP